MRCAHNPVVQKLKNELLPNLAFEVMSTDLLFMDMMVGEGAKGLAQEGEEKKRDMGFQESICITQTYTYTIIHIHICICTMYIYMYVYV